MMLQPGSGLRMNLQFFAKEGPGGEKTEEATPKKLEDARKEGQVAKSMDLITAVMLMGLFLSLKFFVGFVGERLLGSFSVSYRMFAIATKEEFTVPMAMNLISYALKEILLVCAPFLICAFIVAFGMNAAQINWKVTGKPLMPKLSKINPVSGAKKMFSKDKIVELLKSIAKVLVLGYLVYSTLKDKWALILTFYDLTLNQSVGLVGNLIIDLGIRISVFFLFIAALDFFYQRHKFKEDMKMTKQEVKDEYKNSEGNPEIKGKIRQKMREASRRRMMQEVPDADVVITNPTHLAVALKYDKDKASAPLVLAKGADYLAGKIKEIARDNQVEIVENKPLARMLYYNVEIGDEIPPELYQMVAEILAYVYGLKNQK